VNPYHVCENTVRKHGPNENIVWVYGQRQITANVHKMETTKTYHQAMREYFLLKNNRVRKAKKPEEKNPETNK